MIFFHIVGLGIALFCIQAICGYTELEFVINKQQELTDKSRAILHELYYTRRSTANHSVMTLHTIQSDKFNALSTSLNNAVQQVATAVSLAARRGRNVTSCLDTAKTTAQRIRKSELSSNKKCVRDALKLLKPHLEKVDSSIVTINSRLEVVDKALYVCYSSKIEEMQDCASVKLLRADNAMRSLESSTDSIISSAALAVNAAAVKGRDCLADRLKLELTNVANLTSTGLDCTRNA